MSSAGRAPFRAVRTTREYAPTAEPAAVYRRMSGLAGAPRLDNDQIRVVSDASQTA